MRVILLTFTDKLYTTFGMLNPDLQYRAIVVDKPAEAKEILTKSGLSADLLYPLYDLKECLANVYCDCLICVSDTAREDIEKQAKMYNFPVKKIIFLRDINNAESFALKRNLQYYKAHSTEFTMFATGISYTEEALNPNCFRRKLFNFGAPSEDLYYDYQIAKFLIQTGGVEYALIGLAPYSFHYDLSKSYTINFRLFKYSMIFNDLHNFWMSSEQYRKLFRESFMSFNLPVENTDINGYWIPDRVMNFGFREYLDLRNIAESWTEKSYPETCAENIRILDEYLNLCDENNIRAVMFLPPMSEGYIKHFSKVKLDEFYCLINDALTQHPAAYFLDGWRLHGFSDEDFRDYGHLNINGATKFSAILNDVVEQIDKGAF